MKPFLGHGPKRSWVSRHREGELFQCEVLVSVLLSGCRLGGWIGNSAVG